MSTPDVGTADTEGPNEALIRDRLQRVFQFLKEQQDHRNPVQRTLRGYEWRLDLANVPQHACIQRRPHDPEHPAPILEVARPELEAAPRPPSALSGWALDGWTTIEGSATVMLQRTTRSADGSMITVGFDENPARTAAFGEWKRDWGAWQERTRPSWEALKLYDRLFELHAALARDVGRVEAVVADAHLAWGGAAGGAIDHPLLARRVDLEFEPAIPLIRVVDLPEAPTEFSSRLLVDEAEVPISTVRALMVAMRDTPIHPLDPTSAERWARSAAQSLWIDGRFEATSSSASDVRPLISLQPVLLLRKRGQALAEVFVTVRDQIIGGGELPAPLQAIVGATPRQSVGLPSPSSGWSGATPDDILFGKPANQEQFDLVRQLERNDAVLVQGPPGTGKSHTIANLVGHLTAQGKTVLVTSQKGKALSVLRDHLIDDLRPLAVSVIREEGSKPLQAAAGALLGGIAQSPESLANEDKRHTVRRNALLVAIARLNDEILRCAQGEYREIHTGYGAVRPTEAAQLIAQGISTKSWLPGPLVSGAPCPLTTTDVERLYQLTEEIDQDVEQAVVQGVPSHEELPALSELTALVATEGHLSLATHDWSAWKGGLPSLAEEGESHRKECSAVLEDIRLLSGEFGALDPWEEALVDAALSRPADHPSWLAQAQETLRDWQSRLTEIRQLNIAHKVEITSTTDMARLGRILSEELSQLGSSGRISMLRRFVNSDTKWMLGCVRLDGQSPATRADLTAVLQLVELIPVQEKCRRAWAGIVGDGPPLPSEGSACIALERRLEHRAALATRWQDALREYPRRSGLRPEAMNAVGPPVLENFPLLREARRRLLTTEAHVAARVQALQARKATLLLDAVVGAMAGSPNALVREGAAALSTRDMVGYGRLLQVVEGLRRAVPRVAEREHLLQQLTPTAPGWARTLRQREAPPLAGDIKAAWIFRQADQELQARHGVKLERLQSELRTSHEQLLAVTRELIVARTWRHLLAEHRLPRRKQDLMTYVALMRQYGKGTGQQAVQQLRQARTHLEQARAAVPVWIMPLDRVFDSFAPQPHLFDVVIIDEASQCDLTGLLAYYLGKKVVVVGDHLQVQPTVIGADLETTGSLRESYLYDIPGSMLFRPDTSIYDFAQTSFGGQLMLKEHFRCVPDIIAFSNKLSYDGKIRALRPASSAPEPHLVELVTPRLAHDDARRSNRAEASWITALVAAMATHPAYAGRSIGVISLLYEEQVRVLNTLLLRHVPADAWSAHDLDVGSPSQFQGDERDVMLLSMVSKPLEGPQRMLSERMFKSRFNVAVSRARDQLWLVHSLDPGTDLKAGDYRLELISHVRDPGAVRRLFEEKAGQTQSPFEVEVLERLVFAGYKVTPQFRVGYFSIDFVVWDGERRLAVECDGERFHTLEDLPKDLARQSTLERLGWQFVRIRGSQWYRDRSSAWEWLQARLEEHNIRPSNGEVPVPRSDSGGVIEDIRTMASGLLQEWGYESLLPTVNESVVEDEPVVSRVDELNDGEFVTS